MRIKKRFIAGAKCTQCGEADKTCLFNDGAREWIECVACGFSEERPTQVETKDPHQEEAMESGAVKWLGKNHN